MSDIFVFLLFDFLHWYDNLYVAENGITSFFMTK